MINIQEAAKDTFWIGGSDRRLSRFENLFPLPQGVSYNSYVVKDEKAVVFDTADVSVAGQYLENLETALAGASPSYLVILHMEPDHCALLQTFVSRYPDVVLVGSAQTFRFIGQFFPELGGQKKQIVKDGDTLVTGAHTFRFMTAPMVHWPEVLFAYDEYTKALFSADAFGTFGAPDGSILHGPVWRKDLSYILDKYQKWSADEPETDDVLVVYGSLYGHTASAAQEFAAKLQAKTGRGVSLYDASETDVSYLISEVWRCSRVVLFCPTYNMGIYPPVNDFIEDMTALCVSNRTFALAENGTWAPAAAKLMRAKLESLKNCNILDDTLTIRSALHACDEAALDAFVDAVANA